MADMSFRLNTRITLEAVSEGTGIHRATLSKIGSQRRCNTTTDNLDKLCQFFDCSLAEIAEYVPDEDIGRDSE